MVAASRCLGLLALSGSLLEGLGARMARKQNDQPETKILAGVPVLNYNLAFQGANLAELGENAKEDWVVVGKPGTSDTEINTFCQSHDAGCDLAGHPSRGGMAFFKVRASEAELTDLLEEAGGQAMFAEPDLTMTTWPDMPSVEAASWGLTRIGAQSRATTGRGVHIYVCDTGVRATHRDFTGRATSALDMSSGRARECNGALNCGADAQGHGTHCAGTAGGRTFGVAPGAYIHSVKVLSDSGSGSLSWSYTALDWLATKGERPAVASMSLGGPGRGNAMKVAVDTAVNAGVTVVVAGGNDNSDSCGFSPAFVPSAITVGSTTSSDQRSSFSNYGRCTDIWAPGSDIVSASYRSDTGSSTLSGTSMACPHVSGASALLLDSNPRLRPSNIISKLLNNAISNAISGLKSGDVNKLLWVGSGSAPSPPPATTRRRRFR